MTQILPPPADTSLEEIHDRSYVVKAYRKDERTIVLRGAVRDEKPAGLYIPNDPEPLPLHHMIVSLTVTMPEMIITDAHVEFEVYPHGGCPAITTHYEKLIGLSIARGFTHKIRELFGGPRGCTHTTALLQAMAPVAIQCGWSMQMLKAQEILASGKELPSEPSEARKMAYKMNLNTCHIWDEHGDHVRRIEEGIPMEAPVWVEKRMAKLGRSTDEWQRKRI